MLRLIAFILFSLVSQAIFSMTAAQQAAFRSANSGGARFTELQSSFLIAGVASALALLWFVWVVISSYKAWGRQRITSEVASSQVFRGLFVLLVTLVIVAF